MRGKATIASHLLFTHPRILNDDAAEERLLGIEAGLVGLSDAEGSVVYEDQWISAGMKHGIAAAEAAGVPVEPRELHD